MCIFIRGLSRLDRMCDGHLKMSITHDGCVFCFLDISLGVGGKVINENEGEKV